MDVMVIPVTAILGAIAVISVLVVSSARTKTRRAELQAEVQTKLIDRFQSAPELVEFLKSPTGQEFVSGVRAQQTAYISRRLLGGIRAAVFFAVLGFGFLVLWPLTREIGFVYPGVILLAMGGGFFLATIVSLKMSRAWGPDGPQNMQPGGGDVR